MARQQPRATLNVPPEPSPPARRDELLALTITEPVAAPDCARVACADESMVQTAESAAPQWTETALRGRVTDIAGAALSGARVMLIHASWDPPVQHEPPFTAPPPGTQPRLISSPVDVSGTDWDGQFLVRQPSGSEPDRRFLVVEHPQGPRTIEITDAPELRVVLPPTVGAEVRAHVPTPSFSESAFAAIFWSGPEGEEEWSVVPLRSGSGEQIAPTLGIPYWPGAGRFEATSASAFVAPVVLPVGTVRITVTVGGVTNHHHLVVPATGLSDRSIDVEVPHPNSARLRLELSRPIGPMSHTLWVWQYPETRYFASMSSRTVRGPVFMNLPPGRYFLGPITLAESDCRQSIVLREGADELVQVDAQSCVVHRQMPYGPHGY